MAHMSHIGGAQTLTILTDTKKPKRLMRCSSCSLSTGLMGEPFPMM